MVLHRRDFAQALFISFFLALFLTAGFLPTAQQLFQQVGGHPDGLGGRLAFPILAGLFFLSLPSRREAPLPFGSRALWSTLLPPMAIAAVYGRLAHQPSLRLLLQTHAGRLDLLWYVVLAAVGEELLFRGWFYNVIDRLWARSLATATNPLPLAAWMTAFAFSIWHWQNLGTDPWPQVLFQSTTTFFTGLWLGYLRWKTGSLWLPMAAHIALNAACFVF